jgi:hypothetical protein
MYTSVSRSRVPNFVPLCLVTEMPQLLGTATDLSSVKLRMVSLLEIS